MKQWRRFVPVLASAMAIAALFPILAHGRQPTSPAQARAMESQPYSVELTDNRWQGKPVYRLTNNTTVAMERITLYSWSEELLPYLRIGVAPGHNHSLSEPADPMSNPPYSLPSHTSLWFVGPSLPPARFTLIWRSGGEPHFASLEVPSSTPER